MRLFLLQATVLLCMGVVPTAAVRADVITTFPGHYQYLTANACTYDPIGVPLGCSRQLSVDLAATGIDAHVGASVPGAGYVGTTAGTQNHGTINSLINLAGGTDRATTDGSITYNILLRPKDPTTPLDLLVPVHVEAHGTAQSNGSILTFIHSFASFGMYAADGRQLAYGSAFDFDPTDGVSKAFDVDGVLTLVPGIYAISLLTSLEFRSIAQVGGIGAAFVDPSFTLGLGFGSRYEILGIPGTGGTGTGAVPEPATWAMMAIGMGAIGLTLRRRRSIARRACA